LRGFGRSVAQLINLEKDETLTFRYLVRLELLHGMLLFIFDVGEIAESFS